MTWRLDITPAGDVMCLYTDVIDLQVIGPLHVTRASIVEFDEAAQGWQVTLRDGMRLPGTFRSRAEALTAEVAHLHAHWEALTHTLTEVSHGQPSESL